MGTSSHPELISRAGGILADRTIAPIEKLRRLIALGYEEEDAEAMVEQQISGQQHMVYYESLPTDNY
ncbi:MAG TPA: hypothetical protein VNA68_01125 [Candidatus Dormibacteraeota bacterium]|nr:hypothetical protein [Candidatus Dormibacteraeota bacterium]